MCIWDIDSWGFDVWVIEVVPLFSNFFLFSDVLFPAWTLAESVLGLSGLHVFQKIALTHQAALQYQVGTKRLLGAVHKLRNTVRGRGLGEALCQGLGLRAYRRYVGGREGT